MHVERLFGAVSHVDLIPGRFFFGKEVPSMATTRIMPLHIGKGRTESQAISDIIDYVANPQKTDNGKLITGYGCDSRPRY